MGEPAVQVEKKQNHHASNPPWDEEPADDMIPYQEQPRNESNTWTNSNYRPSDQESNGRRGGYRGRGNGHQRGGPHAPRGGFRGAPRGGAFPDRNGVLRG